MATSGIANFNFLLTDFVEEAFERCGKESRTGYDIRTARRSLNLLTIEWANRGINLWTIEQGSIPMVTGQATYSIPVDTIDLLDTVIRTGSGQNQTDINITRISESTYITIPTKNAQGRPIQVWVNRQSGDTNALASTVLASSISSTDTTITVASTANLASQGYVKIDDEIILYQNVSGNQLLNCFRGQANTTAASHVSSASLYQSFQPSINVWPTPNAPGNQYTFVYWRLRRIQNAMNGVSNQDIPFRFLNCMVAGLAFYLSSKLPDVPAERILFLKSEYEQQLQLASDEDREKAPIRFVPRMLNY
jgi:hypothetical protein